MLCGEMMNSVEHHTLSVSPAPHQRARGAVLVAMKRRGEVTVLDDLRQEGCLKLRFPRPQNWAEAVLLNSSGGVAAGDALSAEIVAGPGTQFCVSAQAAERFYRAVPDSLPSRVRNTIRVAEGAALEWLPQETILFDQASLDRVLDISLEEGAQFLGVEMMIFGRRAMGESVQQVALSDTIRLRRAGRLIWHDAIRFTGNPSEALAHAAIGHSAIAMASLLYAAPDAESRLPELRAALEPFEAGVSLLDGLLTARILAPEGATLRAAVLTGLAVLRDGRALPRVWGC